MVRDAVVEQRQHFVVMNGSDDAGHEHLDHVATNHGQHLFVGFQRGSFRIIGRLYEVVVLRRHHNGVDAHGRTVVVVFNRHLTLCIGAKISHLLPSRRISAKASRMR